MNNIVVAVSSSLMGNVFLLLLTIYLTRTVQIEEFGTFRYFLNWITIAVALLTLGRESLIAIKSQKEPINRVLTEELVFTVSWAAVICLLTYAIITHLDSNLKINYLIYSLLLVVGYIAYNLATTGIRAIGYVNESFFMVGLFQRIVRLVVVGSAVYFFANVEGIFWGYLVSQLLLLVLVFYRLNTHGFRLSLNSISFKRYHFSYKEGGVYALISLSFVLFIHVDSIMLGYLATMDRIAIYDIAFSLAIFAFFPFLALVKTSELRSDDFSSGNESTKDYYRNLDVALKLGFLISLGGILFGRYFLPIFGGGYMESYDVLTILLLGFFIYGFFGTPIEILAWNKNRRIVSILIIVCLSVNISLNAYFIPLYKEVGAASVSVFSMVLLRLVGAGLVWQKYEILSIAKVKPFLLGLSVLLVNIYLGHCFGLIESILVFLMLSIPMMLSEYQRLRLMFR